MRTSIRERRKITSLLVPPPAKRLSDKNNKDLLKKMQNGTDKVDNLSIERVVW